MNEPQTILDMLGQPHPNAPTSPRTLAVIGLSDDPFKPSHSVSAYMQQHGYRILPVNPAISEVLGEPSYPSLSDLPIKPDVVNVFRLPKFIPAVVDEMIALGLKNLWIQLGIVNLEATTRAEQAGIHVVMDRCILIEHRRYETLLR
jgi:predicted CoA-binding protein